MSTAALWSGWQAYRSGPLPGPLAPAAPSPVGGPLDELLYAGSTEHYNFFYPANHVTEGIQPALINEVMAVVEDDYALLEEWFGASYPELTDIYVQIYDSNGGGFIVWFDDGAGGLTKFISIRDNDFRYPETLRAMIFHETAHAFEWQLDLANGVLVSDTTGWFFGEDVGGTRSETLCRFLHSIFLAERLGAAGSGWLDGRAYGVAQTWLNSARTDYVNTPATSDGLPSSVTGCGVLFLYYLRDQLGYTVPQIIAAGGFADTLADIYHTLTGDATDPFPRFKGLIDGAFPSTLIAGIAGENPENPFPIGAPIVTDALPGAILLVQAAWGANINYDSLLWSWGDITRDVRQSDGNTVTITAGRADEASETQPAQCQLLLDNRDGRYALGGQGGLYPNLRRNTPIRVQASLDHGATWTTLFFGAADGWSPDWDATGRDAVVKLSASGVLRRLLQGEAPAVSPFRRYVESLAPLPVVYWPMEDGGNSTSFAAAVGDDASGQYSLTPNLDFAPPKAAQNSDFISSHPLPTLGGCELYGQIPYRNSTGTLSVTAMVGFPDSGIANTQPLLFLDVSGSSDWWWLSYQVPGDDLLVNCEDRFGTVKVFAGFSFGGLAGRRGLLQFDLVQDGADIDYTVSFLDQYSLVLSSGSGTCTSRTLGRAQGLYLNTYLDEVDDGVAPAEVIAPTSAELTIGHVTVRDTVVSLASAGPVLGGYAGEGTGNRLARLLEEAGEQVSLYVPTHLPADPVAVEAEVMGPQTIAPLLDLLREVEAVDGGILFDGFAVGMSYMPRGGRQARPASMIIDVARGHLLDPFHPDDDDQNTTNRVTVQRATGSLVTAEDVDGPLGSGTVGLYDTSVDVNTFTDAGAAQQAAWRVHLGTVTGYRYPEIAFDLAKSPDLAASWVGQPIGTRIDVRNLLDARTQHPGGDLSLGLEGFTQQISQKRWTVTANCSLFDPWLVGQVDPAAGAPAGPVHLDTAGSVLSRFTGPGAAELRVTTTDGPAWSSDPADYPLTLDVGGIPVHVEACTDPVEAGDPVEVGTQLADNFDDNSIDPVLWPSTGGTVAELSGVAAVSAVTSGATSWYESAPIYTLADSAVTVGMRPPTLAASTWAQANLAIYALGQGGYSTAVLVYGRVTAGDVYTLGFEAYVNGQVAFANAQAWSPDAFPYLRIRESNGTLYLEASPDQQRWIVAGRETTPVVFRESTTLCVDLEAARSPAAEAGLAAAFDDLSWTRSSRTVQTFTVGGGQLVDDFATTTTNTRMWPNATGTYSQPGDGTLRPTATADGTLNGLVSAGRFDLVNTTLQARLAPPSVEDSASLAAAYLSVQIGAVTSYSIQAYVDSVNDEFGWYSYVGGVLQWLQYGSLSGQPALWLQMQTVDDTIVLRHSLDGEVWVTVASQPLHITWTVVSSAAVGLYAGRSPATTAGTPASISNFRFERAGTETMIAAKAAGSAVKLWHPPILAL